MCFLGPYAPGVTSLNSTINTNNAVGLVNTGGTAPLNVNVIIVKVPNALLGTAPTCILDQLLGVADLGLPAAYNVNGLWLRYEIYLEPT